MWSDRIKNAMAAVEQSIDKALELPQQQPERPG
jgi:hypothetical protein